MPKATTDKTTRLIQLFEGPARVATLLNSLPPVATAASIRQSEILQLFPLVGLCAGPAYLNREI
jgi:hypothetical protein